jgi:RimJ/RimL family protein N-acetyltransferase
MTTLLETERLILRSFTEDDLENLVELDSDPHVMHFLTGGRPTPRSVIEREILPRFLRYEGPSEAFGHWAAIEKATGRFVGWFDFHPPEGSEDPELGYRLLRSAWGKGYATEGSRALLQKGFGELHVDRVTAETMAVNIASRGVMEKVGMKLVRSFHTPWQGDPIEGAGQGEVEYAITKAEWEAQDGQGS